MAIYTNMGLNLVNTASGTMLPPGVPVEVNDEDAGSARFKEMIEAKTIIAGPPPATDEDKAKLAADQEQFAEAEAAKLPPPPPMAASTPAQQPASGGTTVNTSGL